MKMKKWIREIIPYAMLVLLTILVLCMLYRGFDINRPIVYSGDGVSATYLVKTIDDTGWFMNNPYVGGIYGGNWEDYTMCDNLSFLTVKLFCFFSDNCFLIFNLFYFSTFVMVSLTAYAAFRALKVNKIAGMTASLLYSFLAYHQLRIYHIWLTPYYMVPLGLLVGIWIATDSFHIEQLKGKNIFRNKKWIASTVILFLSAYTGLYYAFFTCIVICIAGVILLLKKVSLKRILFLGYSLLMVCLGVLSNVYPSLLFWLKNGMNPESELAIREIQDPEVYALKPIQLFMPRNQHRLTSWADAAFDYFYNYPINNENTFATIGMISCIGFVLLILTLFYKKKKDEYIEEISMMNIGILLVAIVGGIGGIFAYLIPTPMRCYNRLSIYMAFLALLYLALMATKWIKKMDKTIGKKLLCVFLSLVVLGVGLWDQTVDFGEEEQQFNTAAFDNDREFVQKIEQTMPKGTMVFQMPFMKFPSADNYELFKGYMHSKHTIWSYGGMQGREEDKWETSLKNYSIEEFLEHICYGGYRGLYLDRELFSQNGKDFTKYNEKVGEVTGEFPMISKDGRLYFYDLRGFYNQLSSRQGEQQMKRLKELEYQTLVDYTSQGFCLVKQDETGVDVEADKAGAVIVTYKGEKSCDYVLEGTISKRDASLTNMVVTSNGEETPVELQGEKTEIRIPITLKQGENVILFQLNTPMEEQEGVFRLENPRVHVARE